MIRKLVSIAAVTVLASCAATEGGQSPAAGGERASAPQFQEDVALQQAIAGDWRTAEQRARDAWRRPSESLTFWGLRPGMTVLEVDPGGEGWWTQILAPYAARTGGRYMAAMVSTGDPATADRAAQARADFQTKFADQARYGAVQAVALTPAGLQAEANSADLVLVARAFHNWARRGWTDQFMGEFFRVLKPGGYLAVEQHRLPPGQPERPESGYVSERYVIEAAQKAGFVLDARSDLNANPRDDTDHPFGVWTLPPVRENESNGRTLTAGERAAFDAIGESDRMTLRFRKPG